MRGYLTALVVWSSHSVTMNTWQKLLLVVVAVLGAALVVAADEGHAEDDVCNFDEPSLVDEQRRELIIAKVKPCFTKHIDREKFDELRELPNMEVFQNFFRELCPHIQEVTTCMAEVRSSIAHCKTKGVSESYALLSELVEHLLTAGCADGGSRLAQLFRGVIVLLKRTDTLLPLRQCIYKRFTFMYIADEQDVDLTTESYMYYQGFAKLKECLKDIDDETYKSSGQWLLDEIAASMKCKHPEEDTLVLCSQLDVSKVHITSVCQLKPLNNESLYEILEDKFTSSCHQGFINHDETDKGNHIDLEWLKAEYKRSCKLRREMPECLLQLSAYAEMCLSQEEDKQFQLEVRAMEDYMSRLCVEDGAFLADVMHEVYRNIPEHGHALRDCYQTVKEASKTHEGHAVSTRNMKFYHDIAAFNKCVVEKLHENNDLASSLETAFNDILKKIKCVNPEDGSIVLCETIHEQ